jgi:hypothetical protein
LNRDTNPEPLSDPISAQQQLKQKQNTSIGWCSALAKATLVVDNHAAQHAALCDRLHM